MAPPCVAGLVGIATGPGFLWWAVSCGYCFDGYQKKPSEGDSQISNHEICTVKPIQAKKLGNGSVIDKAWLTIRMSRMPMDVSLE